MSKAVVILAAGQSTRMKSRRSKVMHDLCGRPVISYVIDSARKFGGKTRTIVVRSTAQDDLAEYLSEVGVAGVIQKKQLGTGDAVMAAANALKGFDGYVLVLCGDVPLVRSETLSRFMTDCASKKAKVGVLTMVLPDGAMYGRIMRDLDGNLTRIVEARDATPEELDVCEVNSGVLCFDCQWLQKSLKRLKRNNAKNEYYITDLTDIALKDGAVTVPFRGEPAEDFLGINTRVDFANLSAVMRERINTAHMLNGVGILDHRHTYIDSDVVIGEDTTIMPNSFLKGKTVIGRDSIIENGVVLVNAVIGSGVHIKSHTIIEDSTVGDGAVVGPFARVRPDSKVGAKARVGNFVELKKCELKEGAKANHLTYLGDASIGKGANIGCGTITCNYDGAMKHKTVIGDDAFVGSDTQFVAPVRVGRGATIGAGSTITRDVPAGALALSRVDQKMVAGYLRPKKRKK